MKTDKFDIGHVLQHVGFVLLLIGIGCIFIDMASSAIYSVNCFSGEYMAADFFIIMLGIALAFPSLLEDNNNGLSTMRIAVFMMVNVICLLLIKIGWSAKSLVDIKLDQYWMGIIAFIFGAKATQSFFESKMAGSDVSSSSSSSAKTTYSDADAVNIAIEQYGKFLYAKGNVRSVMHGKKLINNKLVDCVVIHLKNDYSEGISKSFKVKMPDGNEKDVETDIVAEVDKPSICYYAGDSIADEKSPDFKGSVGCKLRLNDSTECLLTCSHVLTDGSSINYSGYFDDTEETRINGKVDGRWFYGLRNNEFDIALIKDFNETAFGYFAGLNIKGARDITPDDIKKTKVKMIGRRDFYNEQNLKEGYIINHRSMAAITISYKNEEVGMENLMLISENANGDYKAVSRPGDSGCIIVDQNNYAVGIAIAQNSRFTYAMPIVKIVRKLKAEII
ncbi:MAG TPA: hypothetical protein DCO75_12540 [Fibrobacteres bacterium]|jgi:hypothetical protein|nr:hypothetical protein [Fibrobacterota bacterium]